MRSSTPSAIDQSLFLAWQSRDTRSRQQAWEGLWRALHATAVGFCRQLLGLAGDAEDCALDALQETIEETQRELSDGRVQWRGQPAFAAYVEGKLRWRCRDAVRRRLAERGRVQELFEEAADIADPHSNAETLVTDALGAQALVTSLLVMANDLNEQPTLRATLMALATYVDEQMQQHPAGDFEVDRHDLYAYLRRELGIDANTLYVRMNRLRKVLETAPSASG
ncbi:MAG: sigma-70 family RNA polymerase sigma factor [Armatimonadetes bacterium]|nr:sigma-70 family RNA polymerase sigma factor [Armatimonadota bacterium]